MGTRTVSITAPDPQEARAIAALRAKYTRNNVVPSAAAAWAAFEADVRNELRDITLEYERGQAQQAAEASVTPITVS